MGPKQTVGLFPYQWDQCLEDPIEKSKVHTPNISQCKWFWFTKTIRYLDSDVKLLKRKVLTGRFLGVLPHTGDTIVYITLTDELTKWEATNYFMSYVIETY